MKNKSSSNRILIVGAGLAGSLLSIYLAKKGFRVEVYEWRPDMRKEKISAGRSINLALSTRGIHALKEVELDNEILKKIIPMKGRMIHSINGKTTFQPYGKEDWEVINSVSRGHLNMVLMDAAEETGNVQLFFRQKCTGMNFKTGEVYFTDVQTSKKYRKKPQTIIATDGANSAIRMSMLKSGRFNFSQSYLEHGYKELAIPPEENGKFRIEKNALHIWPRKSFMMIALPNLDASFTCTLFLPFEGENSFAKLNNKSVLKDFYKKQFPDVISLMPDLEKDFFKNPTGNLVTIKSFPWHVEGKVLLLGDSAHAVVPFYGQGMNCAFEDCTYLNECIDSQGNDWEKVFAEFEKMRKVDADAIADLALENFIEMRDSVADPKFLMKKKVEILLEEQFPGKFKSKYGMVTFSRIPYSNAMEKGRIQDEVLMDLCRQAESIDQVDMNEAYHLINKKLDES